MNIPTILLSQESSPVISYACDEAFQFYYGDNLTILTQMGARLVPFSPLKDLTLPPETAGI